jgi:NADPH-dependent 2,4-dienoyl-CoA reductase/sulfur reductase-like enzyme
VKFAEALKKKIHIPVMTVGRLQDPKLIEKIIEDGRADMVTFCRPLIADPHLPKKMIEGRYDEIRQCMACNWCLDRLFKQLGAECPMNPAYSWEKEYRMEPTQKPKKVMVIGGGVGGLQAALTASQRGHKVTLYEKSDKLGGQVKLASAFPKLYTRELWNLPKWLIAQVEKSTVKVVLKTGVTPELVEQEKPEAIVVATGAKQKLASLPAKTNAVYLWDYLGGTAKIGQKVVVLGGHEGAEAAVSLAREGKEVTLVEEGGDIGWPAYIYGGGARHEPLVRYLAQEKVKILTQHKVKTVDVGTVHLTGPGGETKIAADTILIALGREPEDTLYKTLGTRGREVYLIGDAKEVRSMPPASHEGFWVGRHV